MSITIRKFIAPHLHDVKKGVHPKGKVPYHEREKHGIRGGTVTREIEVTEPVTITLTTKQAEMIVRCLLSRWSAEGCNQNPGTEASVIRASILRQMEIEKILVNMGVDIEEIP